MAYNEVDDCGSFKFPNLWVQDSDGPSEESFALCDFVAWVDDFLSHSQRNFKDLEGVGERAVEVGIDLFRK